MVPKQFSYIVEHLDSELGPWSALEYETIAKECAKDSAFFTLTAVPESVILPDGLSKTSGFTRVQSSTIDWLRTAQGRVCLLDPAAEEQLSPSDSKHFDIFLFGGILGDDPPRDRTSQLRKDGFARRSLGPIQMTTDTAVRVTRMVVARDLTLDKIKYIDHPELKFNEHESTKMPFRYVRGSDDQPIMPPGMLELIRKDSEKSIEDWA